MSEKALQDTLGFELDNMLLSGTALDNIGRFVEGMEAGIVSDARMMLYVNSAGKFFFIVSRDFDLERFAEVSGYLVAEAVIYNAEYSIGFGIHSLDRINCRIWNDLETDEFGQLRDLLDFTFRSERPYTAYPGVTVFRNTFNCGGYHCYALYDYIPYNRKSREEADYRERTVRNLVFRVKDGKCPALAAKLFALAIAEQKGFIPDPENTVLVPLPASTNAAHDMRFRELCRELSGILGIRNGYDEVELVADRDPDDVRNGMPLSNVMRLTDADRIAGKDIIVLDDIYTSGRSFRQMAEYLMSADARSVTGLFVAKTAERPERQKEKLFTK